ncbi:MAG: VOC family protein [bacterium]|nr:VOC family protein [Candidatus Kapabacteria bacterium]
MSDRATILAVHPVIPVRDVKASMDFYAKLGFEVSFVDTSSPTLMYVGIERDGVEIHLQWQADDHFRGEGNGNSYRFFVDNVDALYHKFAAQSVLSDRGKLRDTPWLTREFALFDLDGNVLTFYRDL